LRSSLQNSYYSSPDIWRRECDVFKNAWQFAGFKQDLAKKNDYLKLDFFETSVFLQNTGNGIEAFANVCPHRSSQIRLERKGNQAIVCPYHSWVFKEGGEVASIPAETTFDMSECDRKDARLEKWYLEECGNLLFIKKSNDGPSLKDWLGEYYLELESTSNALGQRIDENDMVINANWKIIVENTLESYHVSTIHPNSFGKLGGKDHDFEFFGSHSSWETSLNEKTQKSAGKLDKILGSRPYRTPSYKHFLVFPTMTLATSFGTSFSYQEVRPINESQTLFISHVFLTSLTEESKSAEAILPAFSKGVVDFNRQVFEEDRVICEAVHRGCQQLPDQIGHLSSIEARVGQFQKNYMDHYESRDSQ